MPHDVAYQVELNRVASLLGINHARGLEDAIIDHCLKQLREWVASHGELETLNELVDRFAQSLDMRFEEVHGHDGMTSLMERMDPAERPIFAALRAEFGDDTDGATVLRVNRKSWEPAYMAVINCEGWHEFRRYFSKWHELVHRLLEGPQLTFAFRRTTIDRLPAGFAGGNAPLITAQMAIAMMASNWRRCRVLSVGPPNPESSP